MNHLGNSSIRQSVRIVVGCLGLFCTASWLFAQDKDAEAEVLLLEEVIVTATLREVPLSDLPLSVGVVTEGQLSAVAAVSIDDVWRLVPNLLVRDGPYGGRWYIMRGLADTDSFLSTESINAFYLDDTSFNYVSGLFTTPGDVSMLDLARVEVLRGPQGTLVGANAMGGAIRLITNEPEPEAWSATVEVNLSATANGGWNYGGKAVLNQPTGPDSALRVAALYQDDDGFIDDIGLGRKDINSQRRIAGRLSWLWNITDEWDLLVRAYEEDVETDGFNYADDVGRTWSGILTEGEFETVMYSPESRDDVISIVSARVRWVGEHAEFYSATSFYDRDLHQDYDWSDAQWVFFGLDHPTQSFGDYEQKDFSQEFRISSRGDGRLSWLAGAYFLDQDYVADEFLVSENLPEDFLGIPAGGTVVYNDTTTRAKRQDRALFGEIGWRFSDRLEGVVGLRWYELERSQFTEGGGFLIIPGGAAGGSDGVSPKASLSWELTNESMLYALVSSGFRPGQFNNPRGVTFCGARPLIDDDEMTNYELGVKHQSSAGNAVINLSVFKIDWQNMQFNSYQAGQCLFPVIENLGEASSKGLELDFSWVVSEFFRLQGGLGYVDARIETEFISALDNIPAGTRIPNVPEWTANLAATWDFEWQPSLPGHLRADAQYVDKRTTQFDQSNDFPTYREIDEYVLVNLRLGLNTGKFMAELFIDNVFDKRAELFCCRLMFDPAVNRPRTIGVRSGINF